MLNIREEVTALLDRASEWKISEAAICAEAGLAHTTLGRWRRGETEPRFTAFVNAAEALERLIAREKEKAA